MRIAVFHNYLDNIGGAEIVALTLARELAADIYTTNISAEKIGRMGFADVLGRIHSIGRIPNRAPFRQQLAFWKFRRLNLTGKYDFFIIAGDWAMSAAVNHRPNIWYVHSPLNELWEFRDFIRRKLLKAWAVRPYDLWVSFNRQLTLRYARSVDNWVCNSSNTAARVKKFYGRDAIVINPPIDTEKYQTGATADYWLSVNRLVAHKRIELQVEAFKLLPEEKLIIVGSYEKGVKQFEDIKAALDKARPENVEIKHWVNDAELKNLYAHCRGLVVSAKDEDFGMNAIEAMAAGKPVIAPDEGGYKESVVSGETGILIPDISPEKIAAAVRKISAQIAAEPRYYEKRCRDRAARFDTSVFIAKIKALMK